MMSRPAQHGPGMQPAQQHLLEKFLRREIPDPCKVVFHRRHAGLHEQSAPLICSVSSGVARPSIESGWEEKV